MFLLTPASARAQSDDRAEYSVKLAFLYNFTKFVEWPAEAFPDRGAPLNICLVGQDPFGYDTPVDSRTCRASTRRQTRLRLRRERR